MVKVDATATAEADPRVAEDQEKLSEWDALFGEDEKTNQPSQSEKKEKQDATASVDVPIPCWNCGSTGRDEDGECGKCHDPEPDSIGPVDSNHMSQERIDYERRISNPSANGDHRGEAASPADTASPAGDLSEVPSASGGGEARPDNGSSGDGAVSVSAKSDATEAGVSGGESNEETAEQAYRRQLMAAMQKVCDLTILKKAQEEDLKSTKAALKLATEELEELTDKGPENLPLFDQKPKAAEAAATPEGATTEEQTAPDTASAPCPSADAWKSVSVEELIKHGLPKGTVTLLQKADINTVGQISAWTAVPNQSLTDIPKIGQSKAEAIENALIQFWGANPQYCRS